MLYTIQHDGLKFWVHKCNADSSLGERIACHDTRQGALDQIAALEIAESDKSYVHVFKEDGQRYMMLVASNAYVDREDEIVSEKALADYVKDFKETPLYYWHGGAPIGQIIAAKMVGPFLVEIAKELPNRAIDLARKDELPILTTVNDVWDAIEHTDGWGASIGFKFHKGDEQDGVYDAILKKESSILPRVAAANAITNGVVFRI